MMPVYIFALLAGAPLLLWFAFGGEVGAETDSDGGIFSLVPLSTLAFVATFFGATGLVSGWLGTGVLPALIAALVVGVLAGALNSAVFSWLRRTEASSEVSDREIEGTIARVSLPVSASSRGRIVLEVAGARTQMTAQPVEAADRFEKGARVIVVRIEAGVALVTGLDPELE